MGSLPTGVPPEYYAKVGRREGGRKGGREERRGRGRKGSREEWRKRGKERRAGEGGARNRGLGRAERREGKQSGIASTHLGTL